MLAIDTKTTKLSAAGWNGRTGPASSRRRPHHHRSAAGRSVRLTSINAAHPSTIQSKKRKKKERESSKMIITPPFIFLILFWFSSFMFLFSNSLSDRLDGLHPFFPFAYHRYNQTFPSERGRYRHHLTNVYMRAVRVLGRRCGRWLWRC